jgi:hypothetical protein
MPCLPSGLLGDLGARSQPLLAACLAYARRGCLSDLVGWLVRVEVGNDADTVAPLLACSKARPVS